MNNIDLILDDLYCESVLHIDNSEVITEGANLEIRREFLKYRDEIKKNVKYMRKAFRKKEFKKSKKYAEEVLRMIEKTNKSIDRIDAGSAGSLLFSLLSGSIMFIGRSTIGMLHPLVKFGIDISQIVKRINVIIKECNDKKVGLSPEDFNSYRNGIKVRLAEYEKICKRIIIKIGDIDKEYNYGKD